MKTLKTLTMSALTILALTFVGCIGEKGDPGDPGEIGPAGPEANAYTFDLTFTSNDSYLDYDGITEWVKGDVVVVYIYNDSYNGSKYWVQLPWTISSNTITVWPEFNEDTGHLYINTTFSDGSSGSPWVTNTTLTFKAVVIKAGSKAINPNVDYSNYNEVREVFRIEE